jgi:iron-sulfur cluster repair protein YtfE (RIC family)
VADNCTQVLIKEHAKHRESIGELKAFLLRFDLAGLRKVVRELKESLEPHHLKEEACLYLIGMKFLKPDNKKLPDLFKEHHQMTTRINTLCGLLYSGRLTDGEDQIQQLSFVIAEALEHHMEEEEQIVYPALEKLIDPQTKDLILSRYQAIAGDMFDEFERSPLISMPDMSGNDGTMGANPSAMNKPVGS